MASIQLRRSDGEASTRPGCEAATATSTITAAATETATAGRATRAGGTSIAASAARGAETARVARAARAASTAGTAAGRRWPRTEPAVAAAALLVAGLLALPHLAALGPGGGQGVSAAGVLLVTSPALLLAAVAVAAPARWRARYLLLAAAVGCSAAAALELGTRWRQAGSGASLPLAAIDELSGSLLQDDRPQGGGIRYRVAVDTVGSARLALQASAHFTATVITPAVAAERGYRGRRVQIQGVAVWKTVRGRLIVDGGRAQVTLAANSGRASAARAAVRHRLEQLILRQGGAAAALLAALLLGDRHHLTAEQVASFRRAGAMHLLALSGLHVGLAYAVAATLARGVTWVGATLVPRGQRFWVVLAAVIGVGAVFLYVELAGSRASLARAATMLALARAAATLGRPTRSLNVLAWSAVVVLIADPAVVHELSFQLSYAALLGILILGPLVADRLPALLPGSLRSGFGMAVGAQTATLPLVLVTFGSAYPVGAVSGLVLVPYAALFLWAGMASLTLSLLSGGLSESVTGGVLNLLYSGLEMLNGVFAWAPGIRV